MQSSSSWCRSPGRVVCVQESPCRRPTCRQNGSCTLLASDGHRPKRHWFCWLCLKEPLPRAGVLHLLRQPRHVVGDARVVSARIAQLRVDVHWQASRLQRSPRGGANLVHVMPLQMDAAGRQTVLNRGLGTKTNSSIPILD